MVDEPAPLARQETILKMLGVSQQRLSQLVADGVVPKPETRGIYDPVVTVRAYIDFLKKGKSAEAEGIKAEELKLTRAKRQKAEAELGVMTGRLVPIDEIAQQMSEEYAGVRAKLLSIPAKAAPRLVGADANRIKTILGGHVKEALQGLVNGSGRAQ